MRQKYRTPFKLGTSGIVFTLTDATILDALAGNDLGGTVVGEVVGTNTNPPTQAITYTIPPTAIPKPAPASVTLTGTATPVAFRAPAKGPVTLSTGTSVDLTFSLGSTKLPSFTCTNPAEVIATTLAARMPKP